jgi:hypothetical protein
MRRDRGCACGSDAACFRLDRRAAAHAGHDAETISSTRNTTNKIRHTGHGARDAGEARTAATSDDEKYKDQPNDLSSPR